MTAAPQSPFELPVLADHRWQMTYGERFALEGIVSQVRPKLAIEIGTAEGGSLRRIASHAEEVRCFDMADSVAEVVAGVPNAEAHIGDSSETLPRVLKELADAGRHVDFALIDGDHTAEGVARDTRAVLASDACRRTVIVFHDTANEEVRGGIESLNLPEHPKVALCMLDAVPGYIVVEDHIRSHEIWNGLGLVLLDDGHTGETVTDRDHLDVASVYRSYRDGLRERPEPASAPLPATPEPASATRRPVLLAAAAGVGVAAGFALRTLLGRR